MINARRVFLGCGVLLALAVAWNARAVVDFDFVAMDDDINLYFNPHLGPPSGATLKWMFTDASYMRRYVPLGWLGLSSVYGVAGLSPAAYHVANLALHVLNTLLLYSVLRAVALRWGRATDPAWISGCSALGAALWALHPFRAETVGWASGLFYGPAGTFALLSVRAYLAMLAAELGTAARRRWLALTAVAYLASLLSYPIALGLIGVFVLLEIAARLHPSAPPTTRSTTTQASAPIAALLREKFWLLAPAVLVLAATVLASYGARSFWVKPATLAEFGVLPRLAQAAYGWGVYVWGRWWPVNLTPAPTRLLEFHPADSVFWLSAFILAGITIALGVHRAGRRGPLLCWLAFLVLLIPVLGWTERPYFPCDRYDYLAGMVVSAALTLLLVRLSSTRLRAAAVGTILIGLGLFAAAQQRQLPVWRDMDSLKRRMIDASDSRAFRITQYEGWAKYHAQRGHRARAEEILAECERVCGPGPWLADLRTQVATTPSAAALHARMAIDFSRAGRSPEAREHFQAAVALDAHLAAATINYALFLALHGESRAALHAYYTAVTATPADVPSSLRLRVLALIAEGFVASGEPRLALRTAELAAREAKSPEEQESARQQIERYRRPEQKP